MWNNFCAVVEDLFWFALGARPTPEFLVYGQSQIEPTKTGGFLPASIRAVPTETIFLAAPASPPLLPKNKVPDFLTAQTTTKTKTNPVIETVPVAGSPVQLVKDETAILHAPVVMYVAAPAGTACVHSPYVDFDAVIETLAYGTAVTVIGYDGRFASVNRSNITGWVLKDDINPKKNDVWPSFVSGTIYEADHEGTVKSRLLINDMFGARSLGLPLQAGEYIAVRLKSEHRNIPWNRKRPRLAGTWAQLLRGIPGVHIGVSPKTDAIMEWHEGDGEGRLGYIESVTPDNTLTLGMVGGAEAGYFTVKTMSEEIWRELRPVFIELV